MTNFKNIIFLNINKTILFISVFLLTIPIDILQVGVNQSGFPLCLILLVFGPFFFLKRDNLDVSYFWLSLLSCLFSVFAISFLYKIFNFKCIFSVIYFLLPVLGYFIALTLVKSFKDFCFFLEWTVVFSFVLAFSLIYSIFIEGSGIVRYDSSLEGDFFGLVLSGAYGIHSLGAHYFILLVFIFIYLEVAKNKSVFMILISIISILTYLYIILLSLSRELFLALTIFLFSYSFIKIKLFKTFLLIGLLFVLLFTFGKNLIEGIIFAWENKLLIMTTTSNLNDISSGRIDLQELAIKQIIANPLFSTGFNGYTLNYTSYKDYDNLEGWSTHIYFLTALWKMGIIAFTFYVLFWLNILKKMFYKNYSFNEVESKLILLFVTCMLFINLFWDAFLAPNVMALFSFFCGCIVNVKKENG